MQKKKLLFFWEEKKLQLIQQFFPSIHAMLPLCVGDVGKEMGRGKRHKRDKLTKAHNKYKVSARERAKLCMRKN